MGSGWIYRSELRSKAFPSSRLLVSAWREAEILLLHQSSEGAPRPNISSPAEMLSNFTHIADASQYQQWNEAFITQRFSQSSESFCVELEKNLIIIFQHIHYKHLTDWSRSYIVDVIVISLHLIEFQRVPGFQGEPDCWPGISVCWPSYKVIYVLVINIFIGKKKKETNKHSYFSFHMLLSERIIGGDRKQYLGRITGMEDTLGRSGHMAKTSQTSQRCGNSAIMWNVIRNVTPFKKHAAGAGC